MELPQNVVPMPAEQRGELKRLAAAATPGPWRSCWEYEPDVNDLNEVAIVSTAPSLGGAEKFVMGLIWYDGPHAGCTKENAAYIAAVSPDVALATLAYVEALEAALKDQGEILASTQQAHNQFADAFRKRRQEWRAEQMQASDNAEKLTKQLREARQELADQERDALQWAKDLKEANRRLLVQREALKAAERGFNNCYDVQTFTADGSSIPERALKQVQSALKCVAAPPVDGAPVGADWYKSLLDRICDFAVNHHQGQPAHLLLHALEVDIPAMCCEEPPKNAPAPSPLEGATKPGAWQPDNSDWFPKEIFGSKAEYDASVENVMGRIASGEVKPIEQPKKPARKQVGQFVVKVPNGGNPFWLAPWAGDPGRTLIKENAKRFKSQEAATRAIEQAYAKYPWMHVLKHAVVEFAAPAAPLEGKAAAELQHVGVPVPLSEATAYKCTNCGHTDWEELAPGIGCNICEGL
jgi:hypothetical protein